MRPFNELDPEVINKAIKLLRESTKHLYPMLFKIEVCSKEVFVKIHKRYARGIGLPHEDYTMGFLPPMHWSGIPISINDDMPDFRPFVCYFKDMDGNEFADITKVDWKKWFKGYRYKFMYLRDHHFFKKFVSITWLMERQNEIVAQSNVW